MLIKDYIDGFPFTIAHDDFDDSVYRPENLAIHMMLMILLRESQLSKKRLIFCRSLWKKKLMKL